MDRKGMCVEGAANRGLQKRTTENKSTTPPATFVSQVPADAKMPPHPAEPVTNLMGGSSKKYI